MRVDREQKRAEHDTVVLVKLAAEIGDELLVCSIGMILTPGCGGGELADLAAAQQRTRETAEQVGTGLLADSAGTLAGHASLTVISQRPSAGRSNLVSGWPAWFGLKLAQLITQTDAWPALSGLGTLQMLLNQEISMSDGAVPPDVPDLGALHDVSRRQALLTLGALPLAMTGARPSPGASQAMTDDMFLARCAASLTACWHLLKGSDLGAVEQLLASYLSRWKPSPTRTRPAARAPRSSRPRRTGSAGSSPCTATSSASARTTAAGRCTSPRSPPTPAATPPR